MSLETTTTVRLSRLGGPACRGTVGRIDSLLREPAIVLGLAAAVALLVFVLATPRSLPLLGGLAATLAIGMTGPWLALIGRRGRLDFTVERCRVGERVGYATRLTRFGRVTSDAAGVEWPAAVGRSADHGILMPTRRGLFPGERFAPAIASDWPFGIIAARRRLEVPRALIVRPVTAAVRFPAGLVVGRRPGRDTSTSVPGTAGDVIGVRDHRPGDSSRSIHWPQTARRGELVVCERPGSVAARVGIRLVTADAVTAAGGPADEARLDAAVAVASSLLESWSARGADVELAWQQADGSRAVFRPRSRATLDEALDALACLETIGRTDAGGDAPGNPERLWLDDPRGLDLEIVILAGLAPLPAEKVGAAAARAVIVAFEPAVMPEAIVLPASPAASAVLDRAFAEIGHDPDIR